MNHKNQGKQLADTRNSFGITQAKLAQAAGISRKHLSEIENGKISLKRKQWKNLKETLARFDPDLPLEIIFDYLRIRFPTTDIQHVMENVLRIKLLHVGYEDRGFYGYDGRYYIGDVSMAR